MAPRKITCPRCGKPSLFTPENPYRPFCSERCKLIDLGNWADGRYAIPIANTARPEEEEHDEVAKIGMDSPDENADAGAASDFDDSDRHRH